jgi:hypothetical protein
MLFVVDEEGNPPFRPGETTRVSVLEFVLELSLEEFFLIMKKSLESV